jgi:aryl-alcohol dehydrogenase-like predicted oxidoreductase
VVALPGTTQLAHLQENLGAAAVSLSPQVLQRLDALINRHTVAGARYNPATQAEVDTEEFA